MRKPMVYLTTQRVEAFSDGVFAIAITLLVLEIKVPHLEAGESLWAALGHLWTSYFGYIFSFVMIGVYWANHHHIFHLFKKSDHYFVLLNVFFLMCISFLPFPTAVLAEYIADPEHRQAAATFYAFGLFLPAFGWFLMWIYGTVVRNLTDPDLSPAYLRQLTIAYGISAILFLVTIAMSLFSPYAGIGACIVLTLLYLKAPAEPKYINENGNGN